MAATNGTSQRRRIAIIGSGNWGSAIAKIIGDNVRDRESQGKFEKEVKMWVFEEMINGRKLTEIINTEHENVKYLPGIKLADNVVAVPDIVQAAEGADLLLFVLPHQFIQKTCQSLVGKVKPGAIGCTLVKGLNNPEPGKIELLSDVISRTLGIEVGALMGANVANEVALGNFCETTVAFKDIQHARIFADAVHTPNFRVAVIEDVINTELSGALKNIVAFAAGLIDGLYGEGAQNTKAAVMRLGITEMVDFSEKYFPGGNKHTFLESCGIADVITSSYAGRNRRIALEFVKHQDKTIKQLQDELLNGQQLQGPATAEEVNIFLKQRGAEKDFPLFTAVHRICQKEMPPSALLDCLRRHPAHHLETMVED